MSSNTNSTNGQNSSARNLIRVNKSNPCLHCGKPDWCYLIGNLSVCNRDQPPAPGWEKTTKHDDDGHFYYAQFSEKKAIRPAGTRYFPYPARDGSPLVRVRRIDFGDSRKKDIKQQHWDKNKNDWAMGLGDVQRASIPIYRRADVQKAIANGDYIFIVDGESCADALWDLDLAATTSIGGMGKWRITDTSDLQGAKVVICPDRDIPGVEDAAKLSEHFPDAQWLYCYPTSEAWDNLPKSQGLDVKDWIESEKVSAQDILNSLTSHPRTREDVVYLSPSSSKEDDNPSSENIAAQNFCQIAEAKLYSDGHWKSIGGQLYQFVGSHYELRSEVEEKRRIGNWLNTYAERTKSGAWVHNRAKASYAGEVFAWVVGRKAIDPNKINPDGLNCSNGVLKVNPDGTYELLPHDPEKVYTYVGCKYDPTIDPADCDRLLECLEPSQREIFLRTAAAALNLKIARSKLTGRGVKGLLCHGEGSNGKDTLRAVLAAVYGNGMTGKSLSDFRSYDAGRKFTLAAIEGSICNWASENSAKVELDNLQSLKQFITGDPLDIERKGKDSYEYKAGAIFLANCNKLPSITGGTEAIEGRYGILRFDKTYARNAIAAEGQLEADPRFKDDEKFILEQIAPAMLNKMLERWPLLLSEGIDYKATKEAMQKAQEESRHLWQFVRDAGIEVQTGGRIYIKDLWERLQEWYVETGTLEIESGTNDRKDKLIWHDLPNKYDKPVKAINQVFAGLSEIFPKLQKHKYNDRDEMERKGQWYLSGIAFKQNLATTANIASPASPLDIEGVAASPTASPLNTGEAVGEARSLAQRTGEAGEAVSSPFTQVRNLLSQLTDSERQELAKMLTPPNTVQAKKGLRVRYIGSRYAEALAGLELVVDSINLYREITCTQPDGRFTTWLSPTDLEAID